MVSAYFFLLLTFLGQSLGSSMSQTTTMSLTDHLRSASLFVDTLSSLSHFNTACSSHASFHPNAPPPRSLFPSSRSYHISMYVHILSSCLGSTSASRALWVISKETGDEPLFRVTDGTSMEEILGAFVTFYAVEDVEALNTLTEFAGEKKTPCSKYCLLF